MAKTKSTARELNADSIGDLDGGIARTAINKLIRNAIADLDDRAADDGNEREVTIKLKFARTRDQEVSIAVECGLKTPAYATQKTQARMKSMGESGLGVLFQPMAPENADQETMYPVEE